MKKILIHSYRGGSGKTLLSLNLANRLIKADNPVLYLETDAFMPSLESILNFNVKRSLNDYYEQKIPLTDIIKKVEENLSVIACKSEFNPNQKIFSTQQKRHSEKLRQILPELQKLQNEYTYLIIDSPPGWGYLQINNLILADIVIFVVRASLDAFKGSIKLINAMYNKILNEHQKFILVWNQIPILHEMDTLIDNWDKKLENNLSFSNKFRIYYDNQIAFEIAKGNHFIKGNNSFNEILSKIIEEIKIK